MGNGTLGMLARRERAGLFADDSDVDVLAGDRFTSNVKVGVELPFFRGTRKAGPLGACRRLG